MPAQRRVLTRRSLAFTSALLLSTAIAVPAMAQIEEVTVTAQKKTEDIMTVPIAMSAFSSQDLKKHQIIQFKDLQFSTPSVTYTKSNFTGSDFQIRGIGITAIGYDAESGVAINFNDVFLAAPNIADSAFYDLQRIEVLRGPQSTLYGRGATGGVVNVVGAKPQLDAFGANLEATYGNYNYRELKGMVNIPIVTDQLGLRIAGDWVKHSGFTTNLYDNSHPDDRSQYSVRATLRWQPTSKTTVDLTGQFSQERDHKMRSQKQLCNTDPTGILGCLPNGYSTGGLVNPNATLGNIFSSMQGYAIAGLPATLGLVDLSVTPTLPPGFTNPSDVRKIYTSFNPVYGAQDYFLSAEWKQTWADWLTSTMVIGYDHGTVYSQESYNNIPGVVIDPTTWATASATFLGTMAFLGNLYYGDPGYANNFAPFFSKPGYLPVSGTTNLGIIGGNYTMSNELAAYDQSDGRSNQWSGEIRFDTGFDGPLNFMLAGYYLEQHSAGDYFVNATTLDYPAIIFGGFLGLGAPGLCLSTGCILGPGFYHNVGDYNSLSSKSIYGEAYYDIIPDELKLTIGARWTEDQKYQRGRIELLSGLVPIGSTNEKDAMAAIVAQGQRDFDCSNGAVAGSEAQVNCATWPPVNGPNDVWQINQVTYRKWTGRAVLNWTPQLDFTDYTLAYVSYARGYKAGGFNPGVQPGLGVPKAYGPEQIDSYEVGTKNTLLNGDLQANGDVWYYNYKGLQVSKIENNTSVNENIDATLWGVESSLVWQATDQLQFALGFSHINSDIGNSRSIDPRNPTAGAANALLVKDATPSTTGGENCVLYYNGATPGSLPAGFFPGVGGVGALAGVGIPYSAYGNCMSPGTDMTAYGFPGMNYAQVLALQGFSTTDASIHGTYGGVAQSLKGNELQNTPQNSINVSAQYTQPLGGDYNLVGRVDYYWQADMFGRIFNGPADKIPSWDVMNLQATLNAPNNLWYATFFVKNVMNKNNLTGMYLTSPTSGLYTNGFYGDPRTYGITLGVHL